MSNVDIMSVTVGKLLLASCCRRFARAAVLYQILLGSLGRGAPLLRLRPRYFMGGAGECQHEEAVVL